MVIYHRCPFTLVPGCLKMCGSALIPCLPDSRREIFSKKMLLPFSFPLFLLWSFPCAWRKSTVPPLGSQAFYHSVDGLDKTEYHQLTPVCLEWDRAPCLNSQSCQVPLCAVGIPRKMKWFLLDRHSRPSVFLAKTRGLPCQVLGLRLQVVILSC